MKAELFARLKSIKELQEKFGGKSPVQNGHEILSEMWRLIVEFNEGCLRGYHESMSEIEHEKASKILHEIHEAFQQQENPLSELVEDSIDLFHGVEDDDIPGYR